MGTITMIKKLLLSLFLLFAFFNLAEAANRFLTCTVTCTITAVDTSIWGTTTGGTGASVPGSSDAVILDGATCVGGVTCIATMGAGYNPTWQSINMDLCTASTAGCILDFSANNNNITLSSSFSSTGTGTRTLSMGNGLWTVQGFNNNTWNYTTVTGLTHNANGSTLSFIPSSTTPTGAINFIAGGKTFNIVTHSGVTNAATFAISGAPTIATLQLTAPGTVNFANSTTTTITNAFALQGTSTNQLLLQSDNPNASATIAAAANSTIQWAGIRRLTFTGNTPVATNSFDLRSNSGVTITPPSSGGRIIGG